LRATQDGQTVLYRHDFDDPATQALNVNNRSMLLGLHDIQGYNPVQVQRYVELMAALNGRTQDYHDANVFPSGLDSPLLDLLNVRYIVVPTRAQSDQMGVRWLLERYPVVYQDRDVRVLENPDALPRAWIVQDVRAVAAGEVLGLLKSGAVDLGTTAFVESSVPGLASSGEESVDQIEILEHHPDRILSRATSTAGGLVVFSEIFDPGWRALIDGEPAPIHSVDHALQGIALPPGTHEIELRYETPQLLLGATITAATVAILVGAAGWFWLDGRRPRRRARTG
jgi:hypothetical protein